MAGACPEHYRVVLPVYLIVDTRAGTTEHPHCSTTRVVFLSSHSTTEMHPDHRVDIDFTFNVLRPPPLHCTLLYQSLAEYKSGRWVTAAYVRFRNWTTILDIVYCNIHTRTVDISNAWLKGGKKFTFEKNYTHARVFSQYSIQRGTKTSTEAKKNASRWSIKAYYEYPQIKLHL
jgi:hypothetical protein